MSPLNDFVIHESYVLPQQINSLPTKRLFDHRHAKLKESTKLPHEFHLPSSPESRQLEGTEPVDPTSEVIFKVKFIGVNYDKDFELLKNGKACKINVVPGNKIIGKIVSPTNLADKETSKFLVFPYSTCLIQKDGDYCANCSHLHKHDVQALSPDNYFQYRRFKCLRNWEFGYNIDGGLQDYMKIKKPLESLIEIPENISLHDCCFALEIMLPFYSFLKDNFVNASYSSMKIEGRSLVILNDVSKEINDILIVLKLLNIDQKSFWFIDPKKIKKLQQGNSSESEFDYNSKFSHVFLFNTQSTSVLFGLGAMISAGLESTKSRYNLVFFDQYDPNCIAKYRDLNEDHSDKAIHHQRLSYKDKLSLIELMQFIADLNSKNKNERAANIPQEEAIINSSPDPAINDTALNHHASIRPSITSIETSATTFSNASIHLSSTKSSTSSVIPSAKKAAKTLRFKDEASVVDTQSLKKEANHFSWLYYDKDFDLCNDYEYSDDEDDQDAFHFVASNQNTSRQVSNKFHSVKQMNKLIHSSKFSRVCYANKTNKPVKINAFIFA